MLNLPFDTSWPDVKKALDFHSNLVIVAEPGAGKTTRLPPGLIAQKLVNGKILVLEPRRLAARAAAERVANEFKWNFPGKVGYSVRFDNQTTASTALIYLTEGLFLKYLQGDTELQGVAAVVLDEFHERNRYTDIAIGALKELQTLSRPDLKVIVMSATLDSQKVSEFLEINGVPAPVISVPGRTFPVKITHTQTPLKLVTDREWIQFVQKEIIKTLQDSTDGSIHELIDGAFDSTGHKNQDILVFLPGTNEIRRVRSLLLESLEFTQPNIEVIELHGSLSLSDQAKVLNSNCLLDQFPSKQPRRIILATNIAETSLTLDGVGIVIDTGLERTQETDRLGFSSLTLHRITLASAKQRAGRAGRQAPGTAHRLWSKMDELSFPKFAEPEILKIDLTDTVLDLASLGISDPRHFSWFESPSEEKLILATKTLQDLGAIYPNGKLTQAGTFMIRAGLSARASRILFEAYTIATLEAYEIAASLAALLTEKDFLFLSDSKTNMRSLVDSECDLRIRYEYLKKRPPSTKQDPRFRIDHSALKNCHRVKEAYLHLVANLQKANKEQFKNSTQPADRSPEWDESLVARLLLSGFPDRVARRRGPKLRQALLVGGKGIELHERSALSTSIYPGELFLALRSDAGRSKTNGDVIVTWASPLSLENLNKFSSQEIRSEEHPVFDEKTWSVYNLRSAYYRDLPLTEGTRSAVSGDHAREILKSQFLKRLDRIQSLDPIADFFNRLSYAQSFEGDLFQSKLSQDLMQSLEMALDEVLQDVKNIAFLFSADGTMRLAKIWERNLKIINSDIQKNLDIRAPRSFTAPTGNEFRIQYQTGLEPFVAVRLQELFGVSANPKIGDKNLTFHLLGPNYRPVQITSDIARFWQTSYFEVRKELKSKYPKHSWPDDPLKAIPVAKGPAKKRS